MSAGCRCSTSSFTSCSSTAAELSATSKLLVTTFFPVVPSTLFLTSPAPMLGAQSGHARVYCCNKAPPSFANFTFLQNDELHVDWKEGWAQVEYASVLGQGHAQAPLTAASSVRPMCHFAPSPDLECEFKFEFAC